MTPETASGIEKLLELARKPNNHLTIERLDASKNIPKIYIDIFRKI